ncbi:MAG: D-glycero-beta-D-manno-heptose 1,7-bisphosphate 7-phosphatase [Planctomycetota bacterium]|nr:D-glycero-beta-D-manno-heptose 1,7-bisphosphate 7-phosphatase [Planctomycetota bacterium]
MTGRPAVFLDRDGTINVDVDYLADPARFELLPGAADGLARLGAAGFALVVVTNQSGVARGLLDEDDLARIHERMIADLAAHGVTLDLVLHCPHHPTEGSGAHRADCSCRKPRPGMLLEAAGRLDLDLGASWCVGDSLRDLEAAVAVGARGVLVRTGKGAAQEAALDALRGAGVEVVDSIGDAASLILEAC